MEFETFENIRKNLCRTKEGVTIGKMMSSPAIHYKGKVFVFFSRKNKMVFKLGKNYISDDLNLELTEFNPFKNKGPLTGWYELDHKDADNWKNLADKALELMR